MQTYPFFLANQPTTSNSSIPVDDKFSLTPFAHTYLAEAGHIEQAIDAGSRAEELFGRWPAYRREKVLRHIVNRIMERHNDFVDVLCHEVGKTVTEAKAEVARAIDTFRIACEECLRLNGENLALDRTPRGENRWGITKRVPMGLCSFIVPFNFPLNLAAHKIAPALAVGNPFILKPASATPISGLMLGEILTETDLPDGTFSILPANRDTADRLITDPRTKLISFTGSPAVGWAMKQTAANAPVILELGGNAACIVDETASLEGVVDRLLVGSFSQSGQSCISIQRIMIHKSRYEEIRNALVNRANLLDIGNPFSPDTDFGPMISVAAAERVERQINEAVAEGGRLLCGGVRHQNRITPAFLEQVPTHCEIVATEAFAPVAIEIKTLIMG
ncbi:aldehyde dehydrogenase family protein [bacterium]|nr:aldehyde dehydrogenase family protein [bacterium]